MQMEIKTISSQNEIEGNYFVAKQNHFISARIRIIIIWLWFVGAGMQTDDYNSVWVVRAYHKIFVPIITSKNNWLRHCKWRNVIYFWLESGDETSRSLNRFSIKMHNASLNNGINKRIVIPFIPLKRRIDEVRLKYSRLSSWISMEWLKFSDGLY